MPEGWYKGYDDSAWTSVTLPHDWSVHMPFEQTNSSGTGYLSGGIGWYRVRFSPIKKGRTPYNVRPQLHQPISGSSFKVIVPGCLPSVSNTTISFRPSFNSGAGI